MPGRDAAAAWKAAEKFQRLDVYRGREPSMGRARSPLRAAKAYEHPEALTAGWGHPALPLGSWKAPGSLGMGWQGCPNPRRGQFNFGINESTEPSGRLARWWRLEGVRSCPREEEAAA